MPAGSLDRWPEDYGGRVARRNRPGDPLADASVDAVFAAEAFHWFVDARALAEIARVLRPRGALVLMWNLPAGPWEPSIANVEQLLHERGPKPGEVSYDRLPLLDEVRSLLAAAQYRRLWETHVHWTRLAAGPPERRS